MNVLIIGGGGREHALAWKARQSPLVDSVFVAPGNAGTAAEEGIKNVALAVNDFSGLAAFASKKKIELTIVGPEQPLVDGIVEFFAHRGLAIYGPNKKAAQLEASKAFTKEFLMRHNIPTADYEIFTDEKSAVSYVEEHGAPIVIKADGLAAGKGVIVAETLVEARKAINDMLSGNLFGEAGSRIVIEEFLEGEEASFIVMVDGQNILPMATSQDHKRVGNGDIGPNTGGMGAYSPAPVVSDILHARIMNEVIVPTVKGMAAENNPYLGFLYAGLMVTLDGTPKVIEYNCRFGDPETQPIMMRMRSDIVSHCLAALNGNLNSEIADWDPQAAVGVVLASDGYPAGYNKGDPINGLTEATALGEGYKVFHAATAVNGDKTVTCGGRVLCATALGATISQAQKGAYKLCDLLEWPGHFYRTDIAWRATDFVDKG